MKTTTHRTVRLGLTALAAAAVLALPSVAAAADVPSVPAPKSVHAQSHHVSSGERQSMLRARGSLEARKAGGVNGKSTISVHCYGPYAMSWGWMAQCLTIVVDASFGYATLTENFYWSGSRWIRFAAYVN